MKNTSPLTIINGIVCATIGVILSQVLIYIFKLSIFMGFVVLIIYIFLGVMAYRFAYVHTKKHAPEIVDHDKMARDGLMSYDEYMERYPRG